MKNLFIVLILVLASSSCSSMQKYNPMANYIKTQIAADGPGCFDKTLPDGTVTDVCFTTEERLQLYEDQRIWTRAEKAMAAAAWFCQAADIATTQMILDDGGTEKNPLYGEDPNMAVISIVKLLLTTGVIIVADAKPFDRKRLLGGFDTVSCGIAGWNASQVDW